LPVVFQRVLDIHPIEIHSRKVRQFIHM
jgi:hypothetical protein